MRNNVVGNCIERDVASQQISKFMPIYATHSIKHLWEVIHSTYTADDCRFLYAPNVFTNAFIMLLFVFASKSFAVFSISEQIQL